MILAAMDLILAGAATIFVLASVSFRIGSASEKLAHNQTMTLLEQIDIKGHNATCIDECGLQYTDDCTWNSPEQSSLNNPKIMYRSGIVTGIIVALIAAYYISAVLALMIAQKSASSSTRDIDLGLASMYVIRALTVLFLAFLFIITAGVSIELEKKKDSDLGNKVCPGVCSGCKPNTELSPTENLFGETPLVALVWQILGIVAAVMGAYLLIAEVAHAISGVLNNSDSCLYRMRESWKSWCTGSTREERQVLHNTENPTYDGPTSTGVSGQGEFG